MKLLMLNYEFPPIGGGAGQAHASLCREFAKQADLQVDVVTSGTESGLYEENMGGGVTIHRVGIQKENLHRWKRREVLSWLHRAKGPYQNLLRSNDYDLVHAFFAFPSGWLCYRSRKRIPYILSLRGSDVPGQNARLQLEYKILGPLVFKPIWSKAKRLVACSEGLKERALQFMPNAPMDVIPNGVDLEDFHPASRDEHEGELRLITVGRLSETKRVDMLIQVVAALRKQNQDVTLTIVGGGALLEILQEKAQTLGVTDHVTFARRQDRDAMPDLYRQHDLYVSATMQEGMSNAMLEAMASGLPIVTTHCEGLDELIKDNGIIVDDQVQALVQAIQMLIDNPEQHQTMAQAARHHAERFSWARAAESYLKIYQELLS